MSPQNEIIDLGDKAKSLKSTADRLNVENPDALTPIRRFILALNVTGVRGSS